MTDHPTAPEIEEALKAAKSVVEIADSIKSMRIRRESVTLQLARALIACREPVTPKYEFPGLEGTHGTCSCGNFLNRFHHEKGVQKGDDDLFCNKCGSRIEWPK